MSSAQLCCWHFSRPARLLESTENNALNSKPVWSDRRTENIALSPYLRKMCWAIDGFLLRDAVAPKPLPCKNPIYRQAIPPCAGTSYTYPLRSERFLVISPRPLPIFQYTNPYRKKFPYCSVHLRSIWCIVILTVFFAADWCKPNRLFWPPQTTNGIVHVMGRINSIWCYIVVVIDPSLHGFLSLEWFFSVSCE